MPRAPVEIQDEVERYAREYGRTATLHFVPTGGWMARFSLRCNDPRMQLAQQGLTPTPPSEDVWFHVPDSRPGRAGSYIPLDIYLLGVQGVRAFLDRGNTWSGRGEFASLPAAVEHARATDEANTAKHRAEQKETNRYEQRESRRWRFKIPFLPVGISFNKKESS